MDAKEARDLCSYAFEDVCDNKENYDTVLLNCYETIRQCALVGLGDVIFYVHSTIGDRVCAKLEADGFRFERSKLHIGFDTNNPDAIVDSLYISWS
jgi:hypothetical protein